MNLVTIYMHAVPPQYTRKSVWLLNLIDMPPEDFLTIV